jgi:hypothetical protein
MVGAPGTVEFVEYPMGKAAARSLARNRWSMGRLDAMNWFRNQSWVVLTAMLLLAAATVVLACGRVAATDPGYGIYCASVFCSLGHDGLDPAVDPHNTSAPVDDVHAAGLLSDVVSCNAACPVGSLGYIPVSRPHAGLLQREAGMVRIRPKDDLILSGLEPDAQLEPPKHAARHS